MAGAGAGSGPEVIIGDVTGEGALDVVADATGRWNESGIYIRLEMERLQCIVFELNN